MTTKAPATHPNEKARLAFERGVGLKREGMHLLGLVVAEWMSDPQSVQCFDSRIVERAIKVIAEYECLPEIAK